MLYLNIGTTLGEESETMNSKERHELRYQRRKAKREAKIQNRTSYKTFEDLFTFHNLYKSGKRVCKGVRWKTSIIKFEALLLKRISRIYSDVYNGTRLFSGFNSWITRERGKARWINSLSIDERTLQKVLCFNYLVPLFSQSFIYDNSSCMRDKGMSFTLKRIKQQLTTHYHKYGHEGGIYQFDFKDYFLSLPHEKIKERLRAKIKDDKIYDLAASFIDDFQHMKGVLGSHQGVSLGTEISYIMALEFANPLDHFIKDVLRVKGYGRYMDDGYIISHSIEDLKTIQKLIHVFVEALGVKLNAKKDRITPFKNHGFTFLKLRIHIDENGGIVQRLGSQAISSIKSRLKKFRKWLDTKKKKIQFEDICTSYYSWRAYALQSDSFRTVHTIDKLFYKLFKEELTARKKKFKFSLKAVQTKDGWKYLNLIKPRRKKNGVYNT